MKKISILKRVIPIKKKIFNFIDEKSAMMNTGNTCCNEQIFFELHTKLCFQKFPKKMGSEFPHKKGGAGKIIRGLF